MIARTRLNLPTEKAAIILTLFKIQVDYGTSDLIAEFTGSIERHFGREFHSHKYYPYLPQIGHYTFSLFFIP